MKRYAFCKVFSQSDISGIFMASLYAIYVIILGGTHPIERLECCVDIVGSQILDELPHSASNSLFCAAEMLNLVVNIARRMSVLYDLHKWTIVLGHAHLIRAICLHLGITDKDVQTQVMNALYHISISNSFIHY
jgi:hypothetical protein